MRKMLIILLASLVLLTSCATGVMIGYMEPASIDFSQNRNIAVAPTRIGMELATGRSVRDEGHTVYSSYNSRTARNVAVYFNDLLLDTLDDSGYFNIYPVDGMGLIPKDADTVLTSRIDMIDCVEYLEYRKEKLKDDDPATPEYVMVPYLIQDLSMMISFRLTDVETRVIIHEDEFAFSESQSIRVKEKVSYSPEPFYCYTRMLDNFIMDTRKAIAPYKVYKMTYLMANKPKVEGMQGAYRFVDNGEYRSAYNIFLHYWEEQRNVAAGYNASVLLAAMGDFENAIDLAEQVESYSRSADVSRFRRQLEIDWEKTREAEKQIEKQ